MEVLVALAWPMLQSRVLVECLIRISMKTKQSMRDRRVVVRFLDQTLAETVVESFGFQLLRL